MPSILIADDEPGVRQFLRTVLEGAGHEVWEATNGNETVALIRRTKFDLVIMELVMPELEGLETIRALTKEQPGLRIIAMSRYFPSVHQGPLRAAEALGAKASLPKPCSAGMVLETVHKVLDLS